MKSWSVQLRKGLVELAVLAALRDEEAYGYQLLQKLNALPAFQVTESTVYPLLTRLTKDKLVRVRVGPSPHGPPRRYYQLTAAGRRHLDGMKTHWQELTHSLDDLLHAPPEETS
ncbi:MAG: PadR family transcriptional regulator [Planctomycetota bacterium]